MKITKSKLRQIIKEELDTMELEEPLPGSLADPEAGLLLGAGSEQFEAVHLALRDYIESKLAEGYPIEEIKRALSGFTTAFIENY
jgi:hypothetical protein